MLKLAVSVILFSWTANIALLVFCIVVVTVRSIADHRAACRFERAWQRAWARVYSPDLLRLP